MRTIKATWYASEDRVREEMVKNGRVRSGLNHPIGAFVLTCLFFFVCLPGTLTSGNKFI